MEETERDPINFDTLAKHIPGGIICCDTTPDLKLLQYSEGFLKMTGYSREELARKFQNRFSLLICKEDRDETIRSLTVQMAKSSVKELEYRIVCGDGSLRWFVDRGALLTMGDGETAYCCILMEIDEAKKSRDELRLSLQRLEIIMNQTADIIFEWDIINDDLRFSPNWGKKFGYEPVSGRAKMLTSEMCHIFHEDWPVLEQLRRDMISGKRFVESECRIAKATDDFIWCSVRASLIMDGHGRPAKAIGVIIDIDSDKRKTMKLQERAEKDALTDLYNKGTVEKLSRSYLREIDQDQMCAMLLLDLDNFKIVNDIYGHLSGDALLSDVAKVLTNTFRKSDIVGRIGGDEFLVVMKEITDKDVAARKAAEILGRFGLLLRQRRDGFSMSASVGISVFPEDGQDFRMLYNSADIALHWAKEAGKSDYRFYSKTMRSFKATLEQPEPPAAPRLQTKAEGSEIESRGKGFVEYIFRTLYESKDLKKDILLLLEIVGRRFDVSRAYIFEDSQDGSYGMNTFEWCNVGITAQKSALQCVSYEILGDYRANFNEDGIFYCKDIQGLPEAQRKLLESQGIKSILQCTISDEGIPRGFIGFDECRNNRFWTQRQVDTLSIIADMLSTFLMKNRAQAKIEQLVKSLALVLDHQDAWIYVVEKDSFRILYANKKTRDDLPDMKLEVPCYRTFFERDAPCFGCPILALNPGETEKEKEVYSVVVGKEVLAKVNQLTWADDRASYLVTCR